MARSMLKSASIKRAQTQLLCQLCDNQRVVVKWKCEECGIYMCDSCKLKIHIRLKSADEHEIISIRDIGKHAPVASVVVSSVFNSYLADVPGIQTILCTDDDIVYFISNIPQENSKFIKAKLLKASLKILQSMDICVFDMSLHSNKEILFTKVGGKQLSSLSSDGEVNVVANSSSSHMLFLSVHISKDNELYIGLREPGPAFPVTDFSVRQVIILGDKYERKATFEADKSGTKLFSYPCRICTDSKQVIYIADWLNAELTGRIVAIDRNGRLKFTYDGHDSVEEFWPFGMAVTPSDNIILSDRHNDMLHVLNSKGQLIGLQDVYDINIECPCCLAFDTEGFLLVGCVKGDKTHIDIVKIADDFLK